MTLNDLWLGKQVDVLVVGAGMAGMAAAATAAEGGARVLVVEKALHPGGSAALSSGIFWAPSDFESLRQWVPLGHPEYGRVIVDAYPAAVEEIRAIGITVGSEVLAVNTIGIGHPIDVLALLRYEVGVVERNGGHVAYGTKARRLLVSEDSSVTGAIVLDSGGRTLSVTAGATILATGGFQGDPGLVNTHIGPNADRMLLRSNPGSVGDGLRLGIAAGGATSRSMSSFYGHIMPGPLRGLKENQFVSLAQYHSNHCILVNWLGLRFCDETKGDDISNQALLRQPEARGVLLCDERVRREYVVYKPFSTFRSSDPFEATVEAGARFTSADTLEGLALKLRTWGVDIVQLKSTLEGYAAATRGESVTMPAPLPAKPEPLIEPPFYALEVQPAITFTYGGLRTSTDGRVLDNDNAQVAGLWAAGVDAGGLSYMTYAGGLAPAYITGRRAGRSAMKEATLASARGDDVVDEPKP